MKSIQAADLFCGAGGMSSGFLAACQALSLDVQLLAVNHWAIAIDTHSTNHPGVQHLCESIEAVNPRKVVPGGRLQLLMASPECTHHSNARGGKPMSDQSRATAWHILRWAEALYIDSILIENVREFQNWGPLGANGRPLKSKRGQLYQSFLRSLRALGYHVDARIFNAADYGDATTRQRLFIQARRGKKIAWPDPTHGQTTEQGSLFEAAPWRPARDIIDWSIPSRSIYGRKKPLAPNTMKRIMAGLQKFSGLPFVMPNEGYYRGNAPRSVDAPIPTITQRGGGSLVEPFLVVFRNNQDAQSVHDPLKTLTASGANFGLCEPYLIQMEHASEGHERRCYNLDRPIPTICGQGMWGLCQPYLVKYYQGSNACSVEEPLPTITANYEHIGLAQPFIVPFYTEREGQAPRVLSVEEPLDTISTSNRFGLAQPFLLKYNATGGPRSVDDPLDTITARDRFALVEPELIDKGQALAMLDIHFRMLQPAELAAAMSFPNDYQFKGNREQKVRQIGNAVPCRLAQSLTGELVREYAA